MLRSMAATTPRATRLGAVFGAVLALLAASAPVSGLVPTAAADSPPTPPPAPKVVIIVGPVESQTDAYRRYADAEAAIALTYTPNVVKVYSPRATFRRVEKAIQGASIVIYHGHGNGWPSPYTYDPLFTTKDGFGLNKAGHLSDSIHVYRGEPYVDGTKDSIGLKGMAPNAIVLLGNLCYASGNSEPGGRQPTLAKAKKRADNYASAFLRAGASAVIAEGHHGLGQYLEALFTTHQAIGDLWLAAPSFNDHVVAYDSTRTPGAAARLDPDQVGSGYYRSIVGNLEVTTDEILGAAVPGGA
jgi:hypothetical protein